MNMNTENEIKESAGFVVDKPTVVELSTTVNWKQKLSSRKLWAAIVGVVVGLAAAFGIDGGDYMEIAGIVTSAVSVVSYIFTEGAIDKASAENSSKKR